MTFAWTDPPLPAGTLSLGADWVTQSGPEVRLDPYFFWAEQSGFTGYLLANDGKLRAAIELDDDPVRNAAQRQWFCAHLAAGRIEIAPHYADLLRGNAPVTHFTARVELDQLASVVAPHLRRIKPGLVGAGQGGEAPGAMGPISLDLALMVDLLRNGEFQVVQRMLEAHLLKGGPTLNWQAFIVPPALGPALAGVEGQRAGSVFLNDVIGEPLAMSATPLPPRTVIGIIDFGCPFAHEHFELAPLVPRLTHFWDQGRHHAWPVSSGLWQMPLGLAYGREADRAGITGYMNLVTKIQPHAGNRRLFEQICYAVAGLPELLGQATHGVHVMDIAAGCGFIPDGEAPATHDAAAEADIVFVQLPKPAFDDLSGAWLTVYVIDAIEYILARAAGADHVVINLSLGSYAGSHDGNSMLEAALDRYAGRHDVAIVLAAGNVAAERPIHAQATLNPGNSATLHWLTQADDSTQSFLELWYQSKGSLPAEIDVTIEQRQVAAPLRLAGGPAARVLVDTSPGYPLAPLAPLAPAAPVASAILMPGSLAGAADGVLLLATAPTRTSTPVPGWPVAAPAGRWSVTCINQSDEPVLIDVWLERDEPARAPPDTVQSSLAVDSGSGFQVLPPQGTLTGQSCGWNTLVVGSYVAGTRMAAPDTAAGPGRPNGAAPRPGPDLVAPGARLHEGQRRGILAAGNLSDSVVELSGTSMAAPWVVRCIANALGTGALANLSSKPVIVCALLGSARAPRCDAVLGFGGVGTNGRGVPLP